ncbi:MAG: sulfatase [Verrucomicrobiota bacterium]
MRHLGWVFCGVALLGPIPGWGASRPPHVLFVAVDDLNDWVAPLGGHPQARTPNLDRLARRGTVFLNAHCQAPLCHPSRSSVLSGLRPGRTGIYGLAPGFRAVAATRDRVTLPQHFARHGYHTVTLGKVFHDGSIPAGQGTHEFHVWGPAPGPARPARKFVETPDPNPLMDWGVFPPSDAEQADAQVAALAIRHLTQPPPDRPLFLAVGFRLPHVPCYVSQPWFDLYPEDRVRLPPGRRDDRSDVPPFAWYLHWKLPEPRRSWLEQAGQWRALVRAYLASVSFLDSQVGRLLDAVDEAGLADRTVVVLWSDHGWHLGEKGITGKNSLWERSTRVPLFLAGPGIRPGGRCRQPAELLDLFPTLAELAGLPVPEGLEGHSLLPQLRNPLARRPWPAITTHNPGNHAVRSARWRYIQYADGSRELYDLQEDPHEWSNLAGTRRGRRVIRDLARWVPSADAPPAPGSAHRVLERKGDAWWWEGRRIDPAELEE